MRLHKPKACGAGLAVLAAAALSTAGIADAAPEKSARGLDVVFTSSQTGYRAYTTVHGKLPGLSVLEVRAKAAPKQSVTLSGKLNCGAGAKAFTFSGKAPLTRSLHITGTKPRSCAISAKAQIGKRQGTVTLDVLGR